MPFFNKDYLLVSTFCFFVEMNLEKIIKNPFNKWCQFDIESELGWNKIYEILKQLYVSNCLKLRYV